MKKIICLVAIFCSLIPVSPVAAASAPLPSLLFREVKLKGEDFIVLQATANDVKLDDYWLGYDSSASLDAITPEYRLASATLQAGQAVTLVNDDAVPTCDAFYTMDMPFDLAETKGTVGLWHRTTDLTTASITYTRVDSFSWTTTASGKADIVRPDVVEKDYQSVDPLVLPVWFRDLTAAPMTWNVGGLRLDTDGNCIIQTKDASVKYGDTTSNIPTVDDTSQSNGENTEPSDDTAYPLITELLPNPSGSGNDDTDEFIELYNPNDSVFSLDWYVLQTGTTTKHSYTFLAGTSLAPGYSVFYAEDTNLAMSNTSGQVRLLDDAGRVVSETTAYDGADDGVAWAFIDGSWQWTSLPTPGAANVMAETAQTVVAAAVKSVTTTAKKTTAVKAAATKNAVAKTAKTKAVTATAGKGLASEATKPPRGIHPLVLVGILLAAVGYGLYEHRQDVANSLYQFKSNRANRRSNRR